MRGQPHPYVSRGGLKLEKALDHFAIPVAGRIALDVGASTGGFTDCLLQRGVAKVYAVDVGTNQLAWKLRSDPRVISMEKTNIRDVTRAQVPEPIDLIVCDASFIGLRTALPAALALAAPGAHLVALIKPQFEVGKGRVGKGGIVREPELHEEVCATISDWLAAQPGWRVLGITESPINGAEGNKEFLIAGAVQRIARAHAELVVVGQRLERGEVRLQQRLVGQAAIGDHVEAAAGPERARRGLDDALAQRRLGGAAGMEGRIADDGVVGRGRRLGDQVEPMERGARIGDVGARRLDGAMLGIDQVEPRDAGRAGQEIARRDSPSRSRNRRRGRRDRRADVWRAAPSRRRRDPS